MQEVVDATLLENVETSIESNKSLQMLDIYAKHSHVVEEAVLKGARGNTSLKKLTIRRCYDQQHLKIAAAADELRRVRPELELHCSLRQSQSYSSVMPSCMLYVRMCVYMNTCNMYSCFFCYSLTAHQILNLRSSSVCSTWTHPLRVGPSWTRPLRVGPSWTRPLRVGPSWTRPLRVGPSWTHPLRVGPSWTHPLKVGPSWTHPLRV